MDKLTRIGYWGRRRVLRDRGYLLVKGERKLIVILENDKLLFMKVKKNVFEKYQKKFEKRLKRNREFVYN